LAQRQQRLHLLLVAQVRALHQRLVQADGAVDLAPAAEQVAERDLGLEGVLVQLGDVQEQLDRLVRLLVEQVVQAAEVSGGQLADLAVAVALAAAATDHPAADRRQRQQQDVPDPLVEEGDHGRLRNFCCSGRTTLATSTRPPATTPASSARIRATPRLARSTVKPRSIETGCGLSAPTATPVSRKAIASSRRNRRIGASGVDAKLTPWARGRSASVVDRHGVADALAQFLAGLEVGHVLAGKRDGLAGLGIAAGAWRPVMQGEAAEAADLDPLAAR